VTPESLIATARSAVGTPFRHQGRDLDGLDCAGLLIWSLRQHGLDVIDLDAYSRQPMGGLLIAMIERQPFLRRASRPPRAGDVLVMRFEKEPQHVALFAGETIIHAYETIGKVCEHRIDRQWHNRILRVYEFDWSML